MFSCLKQENSQSYIYASYHITPLKRYLWPFHLVISTAKCITVRKSIGIDCLHRVNSHFCDVHETKFYLFQDVWRDFYLLITDIRFNCVCKLITWKSLTRKIGLNCADREMLRDPDK